ncbi:MAG TPA: hypothetical protein VGO64_05235 [Candidatus Limnocylindrales bacterium]|jgi:hypothetical protein|nr:hypothetical protein [Candidatus Limnocylindrales bacterium]
MTRVADHGAVVAAYVGIGMAVTIAISFLLVIPIEPFYWLLAFPAGLLIGYYANQRSDRRRGPWTRIITNALVAGVATGLTMALLLLSVKALFFFGDNGYRPTELGGSLSCSGGADCVFARYREDNGPELAAAGITDASSFSGFYWRQQLSSAGTVLVLTLAGGLGGGLLYGAFRPKSGSAAGLASR